MNLHQCDARQVAAGHSLLSPRCTNAANLRLTKEDVRLEVAATAIRCTCRGFCAGKWCNLNTVVNKALFSASADFFSCGSPLDGAHQVDSAGVAHLLQKVVKRQLRRGRRKRVLVVATGHAATNRRPCSKISKDVALTKLLVSSRFASPSVDSLEL